MCYPSFYDLFYQLFGVKIQLFKLFHTFGFFVAMGFIVGIFILKKELQRREKLGLFQLKYQKVIYGAPFNYTDLIFPAILGFLVGWKSIGVFQNLEIVGDEPVKYFFSLNYGNIWLGFIIMAIFIAYEYYSLKKEEKEKPEEKIEPILPSSYTSMIMFITAIAGVFGSNLFNSLEHPSQLKDLFTDPSSLVSGLNIFGGLISAAIAIFIFAYVKKIHIAHLFDSMAPAFLVAYAVGRLGCQTAGDGCWGVPHTDAKPAFIPQILWAWDYKNNIIHECDPYQGQVEGIPVPECNTAQLIQPVYPTPIYEFFLASILGLILWLMRKRLTHFAGALVSLFFIMAGIERILIEQIRVNEKANYFGFQLTQSEFISILFIVFGLGLGIFIYNFYKKKSIS
ncbi:MAG: prolipoprotein diacylglyceryl transferase family protein [Bacteroidota bacterium]